MRRETCNKAGGGRGHFPPRAAKALSAAATVIIFVLLSATAVFAHGAFVRSEPPPNSVSAEPPSAVIIWFTEPVAPDLSGITVLDTAGKQVNTEKADVLPDDPKALKVSLPRLADGTYTVAWKNFSTVDGHSLSGSFVFSVGAVLAAPPAVSPPRPEPLLVQSPWEVVMRWLGLLSILAIVGSLVFELFISWPILTVDNASEDMRKAERRMESRTFGLVWLAAGVFAAASFGELVAKASTAIGLPFIRTLGPPLTFVLRTDWGNLWVWRIAALLAMVIVLALTSRDRAKRRLSTGREWQMVTLLFSAGVLFTLALAGHGAAITEIRTAAIFSDYLHLLAASVWIGGIFYLALVIPPVMRAQRQSDKSRRGSRRSRNADLFCPANHANAISRFSTLAMLSVGTLFITGWFSSWAQVAGPPALSTPYGRTLLVKLGLTVPLLLLGAVNMLWVKPRLARDGSALRLLRKTVTAEAVLAALVILSVGLLVSLEPARQAASRAAIPVDRLIVQRTAEGINLKAIVEPKFSLLTVILTDRSGKPITDATSVTLELTYLERDIGSSFESTLDHGGGIWVAHQAVLNIEGNWRAALVVRRPGAFDARTSFQFSMPLSGDPVTAAPSAETGKRLWGIELFLLGLLFGGIGFYAGGRKTGPGIAGMIFGAGGIIAGIVLALPSVPA